MDRFLGRRPSSPSEPSQHGGEKQPSPEIDAADRQFLHLHEEQKQMAMQEHELRLREQAREQRMKEHTEIWMRQILPDYAPGLRPTRRMEKLWRQGLPPRVREAIWPMAIGNVLRITPELFEIHKKQAVGARSSKPSISVHLDASFGDHTPSKSHGKENSTECIPFDLPRTFPTLAFFREGGPLHADLSKMLEAYGFFRPDIGYVQGMNYLAAMLLLYLEPFTAFVGLCNLLNSPSVLGLYRLDPRGVQCRARIFHDLIFAQSPALARVIQEAEQFPEMFLIDWFMTIYAKVLPIDVASVVWDLFLLDGEVVLYCTGLALIRMSEQALLEDGGADLEACARILGKDLRKRATDPDELLFHIREVWRRTPQHVLNEIRGLANQEFGTGGRSQQGAAGFTPQGSQGGLGPALASLRDNLLARMAW